MRVLLAGRRDVSFNFNLRKTVFESSLPGRARKFASQTIGAVASRVGGRFDSRFPRHAEKGSMAEKSVNAGPTAPITPKDCSSLDEYRKHMTLTSGQLQQIVAEFEEQMKAGLQRESNLLMIPTMVDVIPDGHETGELFGVEIGGSKLRVVYTRLSEDRHGVGSVQAQEVQVPEDKKHCPAEELFNYIVQRLLEFATGIGRDVKDGTVVGLCFSFPITHESIKSGTLIKWTKGFENPGGMGKDPARLLAEALKRKGITANVEALVNDTVGILCATRYTSGPDANVAVIMGTGALLALLLGAKIVAQNNKSRSTAGTNACYVEQTRNISKWRLKYFPRTQDMVVNIEWPGFRSQVMPLLVEDTQLDRESSQPGDQAFEKLTAGLYMGDIARRILSRLASREQWFDTGGDRLDDPSRFSTVHLAAIAQDSKGSLSATGSILGEVVGVPREKVDMDVRKKAVEVCQLVTERSAQLTAAAIVGILHHIQRAQRPKESGDSPAPHNVESHAPRNIIAVDGGIFVHYHLYRGLVRDAVRRISGDEFATNFELKLTEGGAAFGAATVAAAGFQYDKVMGHVADAKAPPRKFPPRGRSHTDLASMAR